MFTRLSMIVAMLIVLSALTISPVLADEKYQGIDQRIAGKWCNSSGSAVVYVEYRDKYTATVTVYENGTSLTYVADVILTQLQNGQWIPSSAVSIRRISKLYNFFFGDNFPYYDATAPVRKLSVSHERKSVLMDVYSCQ